MGAHLDASLFFKLIRIVNLTARPFQERIGAAEHLTLGEWRVMMVLESHPDIAATEVCDLTGMDKMSVSRALAGLARRRRVLRRPDPTDGRRQQLRLSATGTRLFERIAATARQREAQLYGRLSEAERRQLSGFLDALIDALGTADSAGTEPEQVALRR